MRTALALKILLMRIPLKNMNKLKKFRQRIIVSVTKKTPHNSYFLCNSSFTQIHSHLNSHVWRAVGIYVSVSGSSILNSLDRLLLR